mmetsp:Transcript_9478/g.35182  ORF Transcript_9478/g.35182 Transcript_9478/m.35182 type:complete len:91 (-) Transcript_9478:1848-2120(-)
MSHGELFCSSDSFMQIIKQDECLLHATFPEIFVLYVELGDHQTNVESQAPHKSLKSRGVKSHNPQLPAATTEITITNTTTPHSIAASMSR